MKSTLAVAAAIALAAIVAPGGAAHGITWELGLKGGITNAKLPLDDQNFLVDESKDADALVENFEVGALIGISVSYEVGGMQLLADARWGRGFTTIDNTTSGHDSFNSGIDLMAGFQIPLGSR